MAKKSMDEIKKEVRKLISDITEVPESDLKDDARFVEDLGVDSMMALEVIASIEKKYKIVIPEEKITTVRTPKSVYDILEELMEG